MNETEKWRRLARASKKCTVAAGVVLAASLLIFPIQGPAAAVSAQIDSINVAKTESGEVVRPESKKLIPLGHTTGIKLFSEGAMVVGFAQLDEAGSRSPAEAGGLALGDIIINVAGKDVSSNETMAEAVASAQGQAMNIKAKRNGKEMTFTVTPVLDAASGQFRIGAWVRDSLAGIGTITYVDPENGAFGALGHGVCDQDTGELMPIGGGSLMHSQVVDVKKGASGEPGELTGEYELTRDQGVLYQNANDGIFGQITDANIYEGGKALETAPKSALKTGKAQIIANVEGDTTQAYDIEIIRVYDDDDDSNRDMMIRVTDKRLIDKTGGIVQGMSGSPIIQNGKLVGAVTHVLINDSQRGYGISIEKMLETARSL